MTKSRPVHDSSLVECRTRNQVISCSNAPFATVSKFGKCRSPQVGSVHSAVYMSTLHGYRQTVEEMGVNGIRV